MSWIIIAGAIQAVFLSLFLFVCERGHQKANRFLALHFLNLSVFLIIPHLIRTSGEQLPHLIAIAFPLLYLIGPLLFLYSATLLKQGYSIERKALVHFAPSVAVLLYLSPFYIQSATSKLEFLRVVRISRMPTDLSVLWFLACAHIIAYLMVTYFKIAAYNRLTEQHFSKLDTVRINWLEKFAVLNASIWILYIIGYALIQLGIENDALGRIDQIFACCLTLFIYYLSFVGLNKPEIFPGPYLTPLQKTQVAKAAISTANRDNYVARLTELMDNKKPYLNSDLSLSSLALMLDVSPRLLSQVINEEFKKSFFDYINFYRIQEAKRRLLDTEFSHLTIVAIGLDSGFNSKSTFNEVFKKFEKTTPSKFKSRNNTLI